MNKFDAHYGIHGKWKRTLLAGTASLALAAAGISAGGLVLTSQAWADEECGDMSAVNTDGTTDTYACGSGPYDDIDYDDNSDTGDDPAIFVLTNTQVTGDNENGVSFRTDTDGQFVVVEINHIAPGAAPDINGGTAFGSAIGFETETEGENAYIDMTMNAGSVTGGDALGVAHGMSLVTEGNGSHIDFEINDGTINGGGALLSSHGLNILTEGNTAPVNFTMNGGTINGGASLLFANGVNIVTEGSSSDITAMVAAGAAVNGGTDVGGVNLGAHGMLLNTTGGSNIMATVNGSVGTTAELAGVGISYGLGAFAENGDGNVGVTVGGEGDVFGTGAGLIGMTDGAGNVTINVNDMATVRQTSATAASIASFSSPIGIYGGANGTGNVEINTGEMTNVTAAGSIGPIGSIGIWGATDSGNTTMNIQGGVEALGVGVAGTSDSGNATVTVGGDVDVTGTASQYISPLGFLSGSTVGIVAQSGTGAATANLFGGNVRNNLGLMPDIGMAAHVLGGTENATINIGDGVEQASTVNANVIGLYGYNGGTGNVVIDYDNVDPESDQNTVNSDGVGVLAISTGSGDVTINSGITNSNDGGVGGIEGSGIIGVALETAPDALDAGNVTINLNDKTSVADGGLFGAFALSEGGNATIHVNAAIDPPIIGAMSVAFGAGNATTDVNAMIQADGLGAGAIQFGTGNAVITTDAAIESDFMGVGALKSGDSGYIDIDVNQSISGLTGANVADTAIQAVSVFHDGDVFVTTGNGGTPTDGSDGGTLMADNDGINVYKLFGAGNIDVDVNADITAGDQAIDIARSLSGPAGSTIDVAVDGYSTLTAGNNGIEIDTPFALNDINVSVGTGSSVLANDGSAITITGFSTLGDNNVSILSDGELSGEGDFFNPVVFVGTDGTVDIENTANGFIHSDTGDWDDGAIVALAGGDITIDNVGWVIGTMNLTSFDGNATVNNDIGSSGLWYTSGFNNIWAFNGDAILNNVGNGVDEAVIVTENITVFSFGSPNGVKEVHNSGEIRVTGLTSFGDPLFGIDDFYNQDGLISMVNGIVDWGVATIPVYNTSIGDMTVVAGNFHGGGDSELAVDALLGSNAPNASASDMLLIAGDVDGMTYVNVNDVAPGVAGAYNPVGIPVIGVLSGNTELGDFVLANGPIDKGLFSYDLFLDAPDDPAQWTPGFAPDAKAWVLASYADSSAYMLAQSVGITQRMWHTTADGWIDRSGDLRDAYGLSGVSTANADWVAPTEPVAAPVVDSNDNGVWMRAIGLYAQSDNNYSFAAFPGQTVNVNGDYNESLWALEGGVDHAFHLSNSTLVVGLLGGYVSNDVEFSGIGDSGQYAGPMAGIYASWIKGAGYIDALIKADFLSADLTIGGAPVSTNVLGLGGRVEAGYRYSMASGFYLEPVASLAYVRTTFDEVFFGGTPISWEDGDSLRGKIGGRLGGTYNMANGVFEPYIKAYVGNEFMGDNSVFLASGPGVTVADDIGGVFGEVGLGFNWSNSQNNWSFFGQGTYTFAEDYQAGDGKLGLRYAW